MLPKALKEFIELHRQSEKITGASVFYRYTCTLVGSTLGMHGREDTEVRERR